MGSEYLAGWMFLALTILLMAGFPVACTLMGTAIFFGFLGSGLDFFELLPLRIWGSVKNVVLIAVPLFVFMGVTLEKSGLAEELLETMGLLFRRVRGGLAISTVFVGALLGASTGIVGATVVTMGLLAVPTMLRHGYQPELATGTVCASGTLGQIIPPSIVLVLLATIVQIPVGDLFMASLLPGIMLVMLYMVYILIISMAKPEIAPPVSIEGEHDLTKQQLIKRALRALFPPLFLITAVLGSIFAGIASPTEAASVGCVGAVILAVWNRRFNLSILKEVSATTTRLTCMVFIILIGANAFGLTFRELEGDELIRRFLFDIAGDYNKWVVLAIVMGVIFLVGFVLDFIEIIFIHVPVLVPILVDDFGFDPLWICVLLAINLQTSFMTPPFGFSLFYLKAVTPPQVTTGHIYRGIIPFVLIQLAGLFVVAFWPQIATWLPTIVYTR
ncbi:TRAP transporter large permease subunit [Desulfobacula sp.]|uniref:TRAP transporter large permease n=1 Tax=Desulfobacula sp. TaxID=2593537 RepID=UPI00262A7F27|nr:TRAP transporter large permease subunit [Desulfobacula sp.]